MGGGDFFWTGLWEIGKYFIPTGKLGDGLKRFTDKNGVRETGL